MPGCMLSRRSLGLLFAVIFFAIAAFGQFTASIQGVVQDQSGAGVAKATVRLTNVSTGAVTVATTDGDGNYRFVSVAPGKYKVTAEASGFATSVADVTLLTEQNLNLPIALKVGSVSESLVVTTEAPVVDTADSRTDRKSVV